VLLGLALASASSDARRRRNTIASLDPDWANAPSARYAAMAKPQCLAELQRRRIAYQPVREAPGVVAPVRVIDGVGGVIYRTALSRQRRATNPHDVFDCRLVLALHDFSAILRAHGIDEALMFSGWRPPRKSWPKDKEAIRHPGGMAIDIQRFGRWTDPSATAAAAKRGPSEPKRQREWLDVHEHFNGRIGSTTCGPKARAPHPATDEAKELRAILCQAADARIFTSILTPNYDRAHFNHVHLDLTPKVKWRIVR
jgi:hypothetical protein